MTSKLIKITPVEDYFSINWTITNRCNYKCMYCPSELHSGNRQYSLEQMQDYWTDIFDKTQHKNLRYKLSFTGGEATINKDFLPFLRWLRDNYKDHIHSILLTTNGSASVNYYKKLFDLVDNVSFSYHSEYADEKDFYSKVIELSQLTLGKNFIHVNIMNEYWIENRIPLYVKLLEANKVNYSVNEIHYEAGSARIPVLKGKLNLEI